MQNLVIYSSFSRTIWLGCDPSDHTLSQKKMFDQIICLLGCVALQWERHQWCLLVTERPWTAQLESFFLSPDMVTPKQLPWNIMDITYSSTHLVFIVCSTISEPVLTYKKHKNPCAHPWWSLVLISWGRCCYSPSCHFFYWEIMLTNMCHNTNTWSKYYLIASLAALTHRFRIILLDLLDFDVFKHYFWWKFIVVMTN